MGLFDRAKNKMQDLTGKAKETAGDATNNDSVKFEGQADQAKSSVKDKVEDAKDNLGD